MQNFARMYLVCMSDICVCILLQYIQHTYTYKGGVNPYVVCMCMYCMYVLSYFVHILCISCICCAYCMYFLQPNMLGVRYRHDTYDTYKYILICTEIHTSYIHICIQIHAHTYSSHFWVNAYVYVSYVSCMYLVCISVDIFQSICACIVCIVCMRMYAVCMVCIGRGKH